MIYFLAVNSCCELPNLLIQIKLFYFIQLTISYFPHWKLIFPFLQLFYLLVHVLDSRNVLLYSVLLLINLDSQLINGVIETVGLT